MKELKEKFGVSNKKRSHPQSSNKNNKHENNNDDGDEEEEEEMPHHKRIKLAEEAREKPAKCPENQKIVDAFIEYGVRQLEQGHTGKGVTHLRAAHTIRDYDKEIKSGADATSVDYVGSRMATQIEQVLKNGKIVDSQGDLNVSRDYEHNPPDIVVDIRSSPAKKPENQKFVDALADFGEHELQFGNTGKGVSHLRAAREIRNTTEVITSGRQARYSVGFIGDVMVDKIDQILKHGKIVEDSGDTGYSGTERVRGDPAPIVQDLMEHPAKRHENQQVVDRLREYGDIHLNSGHRGKGISHLRAAKEIRNADLVITSGNQAKQIGMVGDRIARKIDQILHEGHADSDEDYEPGDEEGFEEVDEPEVVDLEEDEGEYGPKPEKSSGSSAPILEEIRSQPAVCQENQVVVDALTNYAEKELVQRHTGRGITYARAARELHNSLEVVTSGQQAKKIGMIGNKVAGFIDAQLAKQKEGE